MPLEKTESNYSHIIGSFSFNLCKARPGMFSRYRYVSFLKLMPLETFGYLY